MNAYSYIQKTFQDEYKGTNKELLAIYRKRLIEFRREKKAIVRVEKPTNIARAKRLGYKAKKGFIVARVRIRKGSGAHIRPRKGRRPKRMGVKKLTRNKNIQAIAEIRVAKRFPNCEVLNSYFIGEDGKHKYYEVILVDISKPEIKNDKEIKWICSQRRRAFRGLTSASKKSRGLR